MDPNLVAQLLTNDPNPTTTQPNNPTPHQPPAPQTTTPLQSPPPASTSPAPTTTNQLSAPPRRNKYTDASCNPYSGPRYYDSDFDSDSDDDSLGVSVNIGSVHGMNNNYGPINNGVIYGNGFGMPGWPNGDGNTIMINGRDWSGIPQSQWPASVRRDYQRGMEAGMRGLAEGARAMSQAADLMNSLGLGMGMSGRRRR